MLLVGSTFVALSRDDVAKARSLVQEAQEFADERAMKHFYPLLSLAHAQVSLASGHTSIALEVFNRGEVLALEMGMRPLAWQAGAGAAQVLYNLGREEEAANKKSGALDMIHEIGELFEDQSFRSMYLEEAIKKLGGAEPPVPQGKSQDTKSVLSRAWSRVIRSG